MLLQTLMQLHSACHQYILISMKSFLEAFHMASDLWQPFVQDTIWYDSGRIKRARSLPVCHMVAVIFMLKIITIQSTMQPCQTQLQQIKNCSFTFFLLVYSSSSSPAPTWFTQFTLNHFPLLMRCLIIVNGNWRYGFSAYMISQR